MTVDLLGEDLGNHYLYTCHVLQAFLPPSLPPSFLPSSWGPRLSFSHWALDPKSGSSLETEQNWGLTLSLQLIPA